MTTQNNYNPEGENEEANIDKAESTSIEASTGPDDIIETDIDEEDTDNSKTQSDLK